MWEKFFAAFCGFSTKRESVLDESFEQWLSFKTDEARFAKLFPTIE